VQRELTGCLEEQLFIAGVGHLREVKSPDGVVAFRGPRLRMGVHFAAEGTVAHRRAPFLIPPNFCQHLLFSMNAYTSWLSVSISSKHSGFIQAYMPPFENPGGQKASHTHHICSQPIRENV